MSIKSISFLCWKYTNSFLVHKFRMFSNESSYGIVNHQQIDDFCSYEVDPELNSYGAGYNSYFGHASQQPAASYSSNFNANFVPLGSGRHFLFNHYEQPILPVHSNPNFIPLGFGPHFPPADQQEQHDSAVCYENMREMQQRGRKRREGGQEEEHLWEGMEQRKGQYFCDTCKMSCSGQQNYQAHLEGKTHRKKLEAKQQNAYYEKQKALFRCELCSVASKTRDSFDAHIKGQKHRRALNLVLNGSIPAMECPAIPPDDAPTCSDSVKTSHSNVPSCSPSDNESLPQLNDQYVREKVSQIELGPDELRDVERLVLRVEETVFTMSEFLREDSGVDDAGQPKRMLRGIMRVGLMAKQQLLKSDRRADLVLLCSVVPTTNLLFQTVAFFRQYINKNNEPFIYVTEKVAESALFVSQIGVTIDVYLTLTCSAMRQWSPGDLTFYPYEQPPNALPSVPCLMALAEMRRTKFYQVKCSLIASMGSLVKIVRDIRRRVPAWQVLTDWMIELIAEKVLFANKDVAQVCPGDALQALFNAISEGVVLGKGTSLADPCEKLPVDVLASVSDKERAYIFDSARYAIRQIKGNKMVKLLALDGSSGIPSEHRPKRRKTMVQQNNADGGGTQIQAVVAVSAAQQC